jgi:AbiV family abortive infection protein
MVTSEYLLKGAAYALEQCGLLLRDANLLYRSGSYASAVALALFAWEELGRYRILLDLRTQVLGGNYVTIQEIKERCKRHVTKQEAGMLSYVTDPGFAKLLDTYLSANASREERETALEQLELHHQRTKGIPLERHKLRLSALYVDAVPPDRWNRPRGVSATSAVLCLRDAYKDYYMLYYTYNSLDLDSRPTLPPPEQPELPPWLTFKLPRP